MGKIPAKAGKKLETNVLKNPTRALDITENSARAAGNRNPKAALSILPEVNNLYHTRKGFTLANLYKFCYINGPQM